MALLSVSELALDADSIAPEVRDETMALEDEITVNSADTLQALVNAAVLQNPDAADITVNAEANHAYTGTLVIPDGTLLGTNEDGTTFKVDYTGKTITLNMNGSTLTVPNDAAVGVSVFGKLTIQNGTIKAAENCTATRGAQVPLGGNLTLNNTTISGFHYAGPGAGVYVKGTAAINSDGSFDVMLDDMSAPVKDNDGNYKIKKFQDANSTDMDTYFTMLGTSRIENCVSNGSGAALYAHNAAVVTLTGATFAGNNSADNGGAVYLGTGVALALADGVVFDGNHSAMDGGALYLANQYDLQVKTETVKVQVPVVFSGSKDDADLHGAKFTGNTADGNGGALAFDAQFNGLADKTIRYATFAGNTARVRGGAIAFNAGIVQNTLDTCAFTNNRAICGGAVYYPNMIKEGEERTPDYSIINSAFEGNTATDDNGLNGYGGAVLLQMNHSGNLTTNHTASLRIQGSTFTNNSASFSGGAVAAWKEGGDTRAIRMQVTLDGNTFTGNSTTADNSKVTWGGGGAVYLGSSAAGTFTANTFTGNSSACRGGAVYMLNDLDIEDHVHTFGALGKDGKPDPAKANTFTGNHADVWGGAIFDCVSNETVCGETTKTLIYGGTFQNNTAYSGGGAVYFSNKRGREDDAILFDGVIFTGNEAQRTGKGGALYLSDSRIAIRNSTFTDNKTELNAGGAIYAYITDNLAVTDTKFEGNIAGNVRQNDARGGAILVTRGGVQLENDTFTENEGSIGGAICSHWDYATQLAIKNCQFTENKATGSGGALYSYGSTVEVWDSDFAGNNAANGGAVCMSGRYYIKPYYATLTVHEGCTFTNNCVTGHGGAIYMENNGTSYTDDDGKLKYYHNVVQILGTEGNPVTFTGNKATSGHGGALRMGSRVDLNVEYATFNNNSCGNSTGHLGGVVYAGACDTVKLTNSTFTNNSTTGSGGVLYADGALQYATINGTSTAYPDPENITVENCSFTGNSAGTTGGVIATAGYVNNDVNRYRDLVGNLTLNHNTFDGNHAGTQGGALYINSNWEGKIHGGSIINNTAGTNGGALFVQRSHVPVDGGAVIDGNTAGNDGGAIYVGYEWGERWKDNTYPNNCVTTEDCTISHNTAQRGGVAFMQSYAGFAMGKTTQVEGNIGTGDVYVCANAREVTLAKAKDLKGEYTAWRMDDTEDLTGAVTNDNKKDHYYNLLGDTRYVARLNGGLLDPFGEKKFATLQAAIDAAQTRGKDSTIDLLADVNEKVTANTENGAITLNLNRYTLSGSINLNNAANNNAFTLTDEAKADAKENSAAGLFTGTGDGIVMDIGHAQDAPNTLVLKNVALSNFQRAVKGSNYTSVTADGATFEKYYYYGIRVNDKSTITVKNSTFRNSTTSTSFNSHALSVESQYNTVTIENSEFYNLTAQYGPAVYMNYNNTLTINGGKFYNNTATSKGGVIATNATGNTITINGGDFHNNKAVYGGVIDTNVTERDSYSNTVTIAGGTFKENTATADGGVIRMGGAKDGKAANTLTISDGEISGNKAVNGGAVYCGGKTNITISGTDTTHGVVMNNTADMGGNLLLAGEGSALTVAAGGLLYGGATAGDVMFTQPGRVDLCDVSSLYLKPVTEKDDLVWLKNQESESQATNRHEAAAAQDCYILTKNGVAPTLYAARIGNTYYHSISQAFSTAKEGNDPQTIVLLRDQTENLTVTPLTKEVTLNLNGYTLTSQITVNDGMNKAGGCFTLTDNKGEDYKQGSTGGVLTGNNQNATGIWVKSQNTATENPTVKLQGSLTLTGFISHAVYVESNGYVTANGVTFTENTNSSNSSGWPEISRGAAISFSSGGKLEAENCIFSNNSTTGHGGAVYMGSPQATATLTGCTFTDNTSHYGGAASLWVRNATLINNTFKNNKVTYGSGYYGGALYLYLYQSDSKVEETYNAVLRGNIFTENSTAGDNGGALMLDANNSETVVTLFEGNIFTQNTAPRGSGGAVYVTRGAVTLGAGNQFIKNESFGSGSALFMQGDGYTIRTSLYSKYEGEQKPESDADYTLFQGNHVGVNNYAEVNGTVYMEYAARFTLRYAKFEENTADTGTVGVYVGGGNANIPDRTVTIDNCTFTNNKGQSYDLRLGSNSAPNSQITVSNVTFDNETISHRDGSVVYLDRRNNLTMENVTIQNTKGQAHMILLYGGALKDADGNYQPVKHTLTNVNVLNNTQCYDVPVYLYSDNSNANESWLLCSCQCNTTMTDCTISGNVSTRTSTNDGVGALYIYKSNVTMKGCTIRNNQGGNGTIRLLSPSELVGYGPQTECTLTMENCTVTDNTSRNAAINVGRRDCYRETLNVVGCTISNNTNTTESGGAVRGSVLSTLNLTDSTVSNNTAAKTGGAVYAEAYDTKAGASRTNLTNCTITGNKAQYGGGVYLARFYLPNKYSDGAIYLRVFGEHGNTNQSLMIQGGQIEDNTATNNGGGISLDINTYSANYCTMKVQVDGTKITNNRAQLGQDVYAYKADPATKLYLPKASDIAANGRWLNEDTGLTLPDRAVEYDKIQRTYPLTLSAPQKEEAVASLKINDGEPVTYNSLQEAMDAARDELTKNPTAQLTVTLLKDTNSSTLVSAGTNVTLDLGGKSIKGIGGTSALTIEDSTLVIKNGTISGTATDGGALLLRNNANVTLTGTTLTGSRAAHYGGAAYITGGADLTMGEGAVITGCEAAWGGAVYVNDGTFTQNSDAKIESCKTFINKTYNETGRGGAIYVEKGTYTLDEHAIVTNCTTQNLGTVYIANYGEFNMTGGEISGNTADYGAGVYLNRGNMTIADGKIAQNKANHAGGGVSQDGGIVLMRGGEISGNTADSGAGWRLSSGGSVLMRDGDITGNNASNAGGGIYQDSGTFTVNGGSITKNEAATGGGLRHTNGTFNFQGGSLYGNIAREDGGTGSDIDATNKSGVVNLIAASGMKNEKYNVWRDDRYPYPFTKGYNKTSDKIAAEGGAEGGKYLTAEVSNVNDVKLTADYYGGESTGIASNDMYVESLKLTRQDSGNNNGGDAFDQEDGVITAQDVMNGSTVAGVTRVTESDKVYPLEYQEKNTSTTPTGKYLTVHYSNNKTEDVRPDTPLAWTAGNDSNYTNRLIRSFSTAYYAMELTTKSETMKEELANTTQRLWIRIKVPCEKNDVSIKGLGNTFNSSLSYYDPTIQSMVLEGYQDLKLTKDQANGTTTASQQFTITVGGMHNGEMLKPTVEAWFDNSSYNKYQNTYNTAADKVSLDADPMVVSAKAAYNLAIENQPDVKRVGYFDIAQKVEITEKEYNERKATDPNVVYGMVAGYGMALQLRNQDTSKALRGIEVPTGDITFNVGMHGGLYFDGKQVTYKEGGEDGGKAVSINPILWAYKPNDRGQSPTGYDTRNNKAGINMYWNDEDDLTKNTAFDPKYPANITADHSGGVWSVDDSIQKESYTAGGGEKSTQTRATFRVSGYNMEPIGSVGSPAYTFSAGYLQVIIPIDLDKYNLGDGDSYDGFLQADLRVVADKFKMDGVDADKMNGIAPTIKDDINNYYNFTEDELGELTQHATNETNYKDNYNKSETLGMNITKTVEGNGSFIYKSTYWLGSDGKTVLNDAGKKELGSNVTGVGSQLYMVGNLLFGSQAVTPANDSNRYLYDPQTDELTEYYYLTAFDVLMKFDPDAMEPVVYKEGDEEKAVTRWSAADVENKLGGISMINLSDTGGSDWDTGTPKLTQNYDLTILYAAKQKETQIGNSNTGNGWVYEKWEDENTDLDNSQPLWQNTLSTRDNGGTADMDNFSFDTTTNGNCLVYYNTLAELKAAGKTCVAVLYQVRNCCIRNGRDVSVGHMMQVSEDVGKVGRSYATTMDMRAWTTYRPFYRKPLVGDPGWQRLSKDGSTLQDRPSLLYQGLIEGNGKPATKLTDDYVTGTAKDGSTITWDIGKPTLGKPDGGRNYYQKTQYSNGYEVGGSHSGYKFGNTVLVATQNASVGITTTDVEQGNIRQTDYLLDNGQRTVTVEVTPKITMQSNVKKDLAIFDGRTETKVEVTVGLPQDLTLQQGTLEFNYTHSDYKQGDLTWDMQYQYYDTENSKWCDFDFKANYADTTGYKQRETRLVLTTTITDAQKTLPTFSFKGNIGYPADPSKDIHDATESEDGSTWHKDLTIRAEIHSTYEEQVEINAALGREASTTVTVFKNSKSVINKTAQESLVEVGDNLTYVLTYLQSDNGFNTLELCDVLPYDSKAFHGAYALKSVQVKVIPPKAEGGSWDTGNLTLKYGNSGAVVLNNGELQRGSILTKSAKGTALDATNCTVERGDNSVSYTLNNPLVHTANGTSNLGTLYFKMTDVPESTVQVTVTLTPTQTTEEGKKLLTDTDKTTQQPTDRYSNVYFSKVGENNYITSPAASIKVRSRSISGLAWLDQNHDGVYTTKFKLNSNAENVGSDKLLRGITVTLLQKQKPGETAETLYTAADGTQYCGVTDTLGNPVQSVTTDANGRYTFANLPKGSYYVLFTDAQSDYLMEDGSKPALPFGKLSLTGSSTAATSNKAKAQYGNDGTTLQGGLTGEITLGNAVLTGRDDRSNVNAGFYYTELRLEKVWKNVPDLATPAKAKVKFTLTAKDNVGIELNKAVYTMNSTAISKPETVDGSLFGNFVTNAVTAEDYTEAQRTVRWLTESGLPLQAENANGPITYALVSEEIEAEKNWAANATFIQNLTQEQVSSGPDSDNSAIATRHIAENTALTYDIEITKLSDLYGKTIPAGAKFDAKLESSNFNQTSKEVQVTEGEDTFTRYLLKDLCAGTYTLRETKAPLGYAKDRMTYTLIITDTDTENGQPCTPTITLQDKDGNTLYTASIQANKGGTPTVKVVKNNESAESATVMTGGKCLEVAPETNLPIRTQIDLQVTDAYLFSLPFTGGDGMNRTVATGIGLMALAAALAGVVTIRKRKKGRDTT